MRLSLNSEVEKSTRWTERMERRPTPDQEVLRRENEGLRRQVELLREQLDKQAEQLGKKEQRITDAEK